MTNQEKNPSGFHHGFDVGYALAYGVDEAIMIKTLQFFITANANRGHNFHNDRFWTYDNLEDFSKHFPYWTVKQVRRIVDSLVKQGVIIKGDFNKNRYDRTSWYAFSEQEKFIKFINPAKKPQDIEKEHDEKYIKEKSAVLPKRENRTDQMGDSTFSQMGKSSNTSTISSTIQYTTSLEVPSKVEKPTKVGSVRVSFGSHVKLTEEEHQELCKKYTESTIKIIIEEMNDYCLASNPKGYNNYAAAIRQWMRKRITEKSLLSGSSMEKNRAYAMKIAEQLNSIQKQYQLNILTQHVEFISLTINMQPICLNFTEKGFTEQFDNLLRNRGFNLK